MILSGLTFEMMTIFSLILLTAILFVSEVVRIDVVACCILLLLGITDLVPRTELFSGFSSDAVISLIGVMIVGAGLEKSGLMVAVTKWISKVGGESEPRLRLLLMFSGGLLAGLLRSVGAVALLLPVVTRISRRTGLSKSRFLMPLGYCAILGSTMTMVGTGPLIILNSVLEVHWADILEEPIAPFGLLEVLPIGIVMLITGVLYFFLLGPFLIPKTKSTSRPPGSSTEHFMKTYGIGGQAFEIRVQADSPLIGLELRDVETQMNPSLAIVGLKMGNQYWMPPLRVDVIQSGMVIAMLGDEKQVSQFAKATNCRLSTCLTAFIERLNPAVSGLCEVVLPPSSELVGDDFTTLHMRREHGVQVLAIHRAGVTYRLEELKEISLKPGDTLGIFCEWEKMASLEKNPDFVVVTSDYPHESYRRDKAPTALFFSILGISLVLAGFLALPIGLLLSVVGMVIGKVLTIDEAYAAVSWRTVFLFAGLLPLGIAMQATGADEWLIVQLFSGVEQWPITSVLALLALATSLLTLVLSNVGVTVLLIPLSMKLALLIGGDPRLFVLTVALAASNAFILPTHQANALIVGPGHYQAKDFLKAGVGMTILYLIIILVMVPMIV